MSSSLARTAAHLASALSRPARAKSLLRTLGRAPVVDLATTLYQATPAEGFLDLFPEAEGLTPSLSDLRLRRRGWNTLLHEELFLALATKALRPGRIFEIGTFDGGTTRALAENAPDDAQLFTIDLPAQTFTDTRGTTDFAGEQIGEIYRNSPAASRITQLRGDTQTYDFSPYVATVDLCFVDACHLYPFVLKDTHTALRLTKPGGVIFWHDFEPNEFHGLVQAVCERTQGLPLRRLAGTSMAVLRVPA